MAHLDSPHSSSKQLYRRLGKKELTVLTSASCIIWLYLTEALLSGNNCFFLTLVQLQPSFYLFNRPIPFASINVACGPIRILVCVKFCFIQWWTCELEHINVIMLSVKFLMYRPVPIAFVPKSNFTRFFRIRSFHSRFSS